MLCTRTSEHRPPAASPLFTLLMTVLMIAVFGSEAQAAIRLVTSPLDSGPGSLRAEVLAAAPGDEILITTTDVITVTSSAISISQDLTIGVQGITQAVIEHSNGDYPLIWVSGGNVRLQDLQIRNVFKSADIGVLLLDAGELTVTGCTFRNNTNEYGGAITANAGCLTVLSSEFVNNQAKVHGGAIYVCQADVTFNTCTFTGNAVDKNGGVIYVERPDTTHGDSTLVYFEASTFKSNSSLIDGGVIFSEGGGTQFCLLSMTNCVFEQNSAGAQGGVLKLEGGSQDLKAANCDYLFNSAKEGGVLLVGGANNLNISDCTFSDNSTVGGDSGGAIDQRAGQLFCHSTTFDSNIAQDAGGAVEQSAGLSEYTACTFVGNEARTADGGAINYSGGSITVDQCTFVDNVAQRDGGGYAGTANGGKVFNSTFSSNLAGRNGGGVFTDVNQLDIKSCTITKNVADFDKDGIGDGGGLWAETKLFLSNIIADNSDLGTEFPDIKEVLSSDGFNLIGTVGQYNFNSNTNGDQYGDPNGTTLPNAGAIESFAVINPQLNALASNGGLTQTHALQPASPAIDKSTSANVSLVDQRGVARFLRPDIGAFEFEPILEVMGSTTPCLGTSYKYSIVNFSAVDYTWQVSGGTVISGQSTNCITIEWTATSASLQLEMEFGGSVVFSTQLSIIPSAVIALFDYVSITENTVTTINVLSNDSGYNLVLDSVEPASNGTLTFSASGAVTYTPDANIRGIERLEYSISNDGCSSSGTLVIAVGPQQQYMFSVETDSDKVRKDGVDGVNGLRRAKDLVVSPDGRHAYVTGQYDHSIAIFELDEEDDPVYLGRVRHQHGGVSGLSYVNLIEISPDGRHVYACSYRSSSIAVFERDAAAGTLQFVQEFDLNQIVGNALYRFPFGLVATSDGKHLLTTGYYSNSLIVLERNASTGKLNVLQTFQNGRQAVRGLNRAAGVDVTLDGGSVYVCSNGSDELAHFQRDPSSGLLTFIGRYRNRIYSGMTGTIAVATSPDSRSVYVAANLSDAIVVFNRDPESGILTYVQRLKNRQNGVDGLNQIKDLAVSPDGSSLFAVSSRDDALVYFERDADGSLEYAGHHEDNNNGADGLNNASAVAIAPNSSRVYCASIYDSAFSEFIRDMRPVLVNDVAADVLVNRETTIDVLSNDFDPDGGELTIISAGNGGLGTTQIVGGGTSIKYLAGASAGVDVFIYIVSDEYGHTATALVEVYVQLSKTGLREAKIVTEAAALMLSPNPARQTVNIKYAIENSAVVSLELLDFQGQRVQTLNLGKKDNGEFTHSLSLVQATGAPLAAGTYFVRLGVQTQNEAWQHHTVPLIVK